jgi:Protein of unknown function (DUF3108)
MIIPTRTLRKLALLTVAVVWVHGLMLGGLPQSLGWLHTVQSLDGNSTTVFLTRSIMAPAPPLASPPLTPALPTKPQRPKTAATTPSAAPSPQAPTVQTSPTFEKNNASTPVDTEQTATKNIAKLTDPAAPTPPTQERAPQPAIHPGAAGAMAAAVYTVPAPVRVKYDIQGEVKGFPYFANGELLWLQDGKTYDARLEISHFLLGSRVQTSKGLISAQGLEPIRFGDKVRSEVAAHFERDKGKVIFSANTPDADLLPGAQDQLSVLLQISTLVGSDPARYIRGTQVPFQAIGPRSAENWVFTAGELEKITLHNGETTGLKFTRPPMSEFEPRLEVWFGPDVGYLPVRVRLTQSNGDFVDQLWRTTQKP